MDISLHLLLSLVVFELCLAGFCRRADTNQRAKLLDGLGTDALDFLQLLNAFEIAIFIAPLQDGRRLGWANARQLFGKLQCIGGIDIQQLITGNNDL